MAWTTLDSLIGDDLLDSIVELCPIINDQMYMLGRARKSWSHVNKTTPTAADFVGTDSGGTVHARNVIEDILTEMRTQISTSITYTVGTGPTLEDIATYYFRDSDWSTYTGDTINGALDPSDIEDWKAIIENLRDVVTDLQYVEFKGHAAYNMADSGVTQVRYGAATASEDGQTSLASTTGITSWDTDALQNILDQFPWYRIQCREDVTDPDQWDFLQRTLVFKLQPFDFDSGDTTGMTLTLYRFDAASGITYNHDRTSVPSTGGGALKLRIGVAADHTTTVPLNPTGTVLATVDLDVEDGNTMGNIDITSSLTVSSLQSPIYMVSHVELDTLKDTSSDWYNGVPVGRVSSWSDQGFPTNADFDNVKYDTTLNGCTVRISRAPDLP